MWKPQSKVLISQISHFCLASEVLKFFAQSESAFSQRASEYSRTWEMLGQPRVRERLWSSLPYKNLLEM